VKVLALDYGSARTGVAVSDATGTLARPLEVVPCASEPAGLKHIAELVEREEVDCVVVGLPLTLRGERGAQAEEADAFITALRAVTDVPIESFDERFTTKLALQTRQGQAKRSAADVPPDALAAAHLLTTYLEWKSTVRS
jgi:putative holliday junction resolvase